MAAKECRNVSNVQHIHLIIKHFFFPCSSLLSFNDNYTSRLVRLDLCCACPCCADVCGGELERKAGACNAVEKLRLLGWSSSFSYLWKATSPSPICRHTQVPRLYLPLGVQDVQLSPKTLLVLFPELPFRGGRISLYHLPLNHHLLKCPSLRTQFLIQVTCL